MIKVKNKCSISGFALALLFEMILAVRRKLGNLPGLPLVLSEVLYNVRSNIRNSEQPLRSYRHSSCKSFRIRSYKNTGGGGTPTLSRLPSLPRASKGAHLAKGCKNSATATLTTFRINTCKSVSKQRTLTPLRINTYKKPGEGGVPTLPRVQCPASSIRPPEPYAPRGASIPCGLTRLRILPATTGLPAVVGVYYPLRALLRCTEAQKYLSVTPLLATLTHSLSRKSFPCHSYANTRDGGATMPFQFFPSALCFSVPARRPAGGPSACPRLGRGGKSLFSSSLQYLFRYVSTPELLLPSIHSANITKVQTRGAAGVAGSRADKAWQP